MDAHEAAELYPPNPREVPPDLTVPSRAYRRSAWIAFAGILAFVALYLGLTAHLGWTVYRLLRDAFVGGHFLSFLWAIPAVFFFAFLVRGLFAFARRPRLGVVEVRPEDEPRLFEFIHRIADDVRAPRPQRVFLSADINAAVYYDLSFWNLLLPTRKNLQLGLGLVNVLSLDELKAVIGHELGHFAQRTMAVGRWVYIAQQIAGQIVASRGAFDSILQWISSIDLRIAWIGWIMRLMVWAIRAVLDTAFRILVLAQRALSREMELQADLVAVSVSGSDSLIHALHRLNDADASWDHVLGIFDGDTARGQPPADLVAIQTRVMEHHRRVRSNPRLGLTPELPVDARERHRVFEAELAQPPRMWSTHPPNHEREENAKRVYLPSALDARSPWLLFANPDATRRTVTRALLDAAWPESKHEPVPTEQTLARIDEDYARPPLDPRYRGLYLDRAVTGGVARAADLYDPIADASRESVLADLDALYPESLSQDLERWVELGAERGQLLALQAGVLTAPGGMIRHRGEEIPRKHLAQVIERVKHEHTSAEDRVLAHDRAVRTAHRRAARLLGPDWERYLVSLAELLHYAEHVSADLRDSAGYLRHVIDVVTADGHVSDGERTRVLAAAQDLYAILDAAFAQRASVTLPEAVAKKLGRTRFDEVLTDPFDLGAPARADLGDWLNVIDSWVSAVLGAFGALTETTLDVLLDAEALVAEHVRSETDPGPAPSPAQVPAQYATRVTGQERERELRLSFWDRFQLADGFWPGTARFVAASALLAPALFVTGGASTTSLTVYNGLGVPVVVSIDGDEARIAPRSFDTLDVSANDHAAIVARTMEGEEIERFEADLDDAWAHPVYNVASAAPLVEWTAVYGSRSAPPERPLGAPRFFTTNADAIFVDPPESISTSRGSSGGTRLVLSAVIDVAPPLQWRLVQHPAEQAGLARAHARFDASTDPDVLTWLGSLDPAAKLEVVRARVAREPRSVMWRSIEQDLDRSVCASRGALDASDPDEAYLAARCVEDPVARGAALLEAHRLHPRHPWLALAAGYEHARAGRWDEAQGLLTAVHRQAVLAPLRTHAVLDLARIRRISGTSVMPADMSDLAPRSWLLAFLLRFEGIGEGANDPTFEPYRRLERGELRPAADLAGDDHTLLRLAAASEGATPDLRERAWRLGAEEGLTEVTVWPTIALALRDGRDVTPWLEQARRIDEETAEAIAPLLAGELASSPARMDEVVRVLDPFQRGQALVMGIVLLGADAPPEWRRAAKALLFVGERPYFAP